MDEPEILIAREERRLGTVRELSRRCERGELTRLVAGAYIDTASWQALDADSQYRLRVKAVARLEPGAQLSHWSAAAMWQLPCLTRWPTTVHARTATSTGGVSTQRLRRHALGLDPDPTTIDGVQVTSLARTVADLASLPNMATAVGFLDAALAGRHRRGARLDRDDIGRVFAADLHPVSPARARRALAFADSRAESVGESLSRVQIAALGFAPPELQVPFADDRGHIGRVDFFWRDAGVVGEFDGRVKYGPTRAFARDIPAHEVLVREKYREDRVRRQVRAFVRWDWETARDRAALAHLLRDAGVPTRHFGTHAFA
jgi:hypothetical protein